MIRARAHEHTLAHFEVGDIEAAVAELAARGVEFLDYTQGPLATTGHIAVLGTSRAAWFRDPDVNTWDCDRDSGPCRRPQVAGDAGMVRRTSAPPEAGDSATASPPCARAIPRTMASPRPVPPGRLRLGSSR